MTAIKNGTLLVKDSNGNTARVATLSQTDITALNTALADIEANKRKISSISANYVTTNTQQAITRKKIFANQEYPLEIRDDRYDNSVTPTARIHNSIILYDKNNKGVGMLQFEHGPSGHHLVRISAIAQNADGNNIYAPLTVGIKPDGTTSTHAPSPASNSNDNCIATTAWVKSKMLDFIYPVGSIYMSVNNVSPQTFLGGTWVALKDRFLIGAGNSYAVNATGGATTHTLSVNEMPSHSHTFAGSSIAAHSHNMNFSNVDSSSNKINVNHLIAEVLSSSGGVYCTGYTASNRHSTGYTESASASSTSGSIAASGGNAAHSIMNPYLAVYMWKRTA